MARLAVLTLCMLGVALAPCRVFAQSYPRLHILAMGMHADRSRVAAHELFHVSVRLRIAEGADALQEPVLGTLDNCTIVSSERRRASAPDGSTEFLETLTLEAGDVGVATISPAYIDAIDSRTGQAARYSTNAVRVLVIPGETPVDAALREISQITRYTVVGLGVVAAIIVLLVFVIVRARRRRKARPATSTLAADEVVVAAPVVSRDERVAAALRAFRASHEPKDLVALRTALFAYVGLAPGATLADVLATIGHEPRALRLALLAAERAVFGPQGERESASDDLVAALEAYFARDATK